ncbi:hypothetical protein GCM10027514_43830 [Azotobacter armeniacus]
MTESLRIALIGAGAMGCQHYQHLKDLPEARLYAVADPGPQAAALFPPPEEIRHERTHSFPGRPDRARTVPARHAGGGRPRRQTLARLRDIGIKVLDVEIVRVRLKPDTRVADFEPILAAGAELGASELLVAGNDPDEARQTDNFAALCDLAAGFGLNPHLEFMPWTDARDLIQAMRIVDNAERANGCVLIDAFHFDRPASRLEDLARLDPARIHYAQLRDVAGPRPDDMDEILRQAPNERRFPAVSDCDLFGLLRTLPANLPLSLEIPTRQLLEQGVSALERA